MEMVFFIILALFNVFAFSLVYCMGCYVLRLGEKMVMAKVTKRIKDQCKKEEAKALERWAIFPRGDYNNGTGIVLARQVKENGNV